MPEPKKATKKTVRDFQSPIDSQIGGVRLVANRSAKPEVQPVDGQLDEIQPPETALVSKLIEFIKKI